MLLESVPFTVNKELHNLIRGTPAKEYACIGNFWTIVPRGDGGENGLSSGTCGPIGPRHDGAAAKTNKGSVRRGFLLTLGWFLLKTQDMIFFQHRVRMVEQTERVCAVYASLVPIRRKA